MLNKSFLTALANMALAVVISWLLLAKLDGVREHKRFADETVEKKEVPVAGDTTQTRTETTITPVKVAPLQKGETPYVDFYDIIILMLIAGALGGVLCNLRGVFVNYRRDGELPERLVVPYMVRPFTAAICGLFVYFVASLLVTSITLTPVAYGVGFQGMISYVAMAIVAGYGAQEFMERLKELAVTLFGEKAERTAGDNLQEWYRLKEKGVISDEDYNALKEKVVGGGGGGSSVPLAPEFESKKSAPPTFDTQKD